MFTRVMELILAASTMPVSCRDAREVQEDTIHNLNTLRMRNQKPHQDGLVEPAMRFAAGPTWSLIYLWLRCKHGWKGGETSPQTMAEIHESLKQHFQPILEEIADGR